MLITLQFNSDNGEWHKKEYPQYPEEAADTVHVIASKQKDHVLTYQQKLLFSAEIYAIKNIETLIFYGMQPKLFFTENDNFIYTLKDVMTVMALDSLTCEGIEHKNMRCDNFDQEEFERLQNYARMNVLGARRKQISMKLIAFFYAYTLPPRRSYNSVSSASSLWNADSNSQLDIWRELRDQWTIALNQFNNQSNQSVAISRGFDLAVQQIINDLTDYPRGWLGVAASDPSLGVTGVKAKLLSQLINLARELKEENGVSDDVWVVPELLIKEGNVEISSCTQIIIEITRFLLNGYLGCAVTVNKKEVKSIAKELGEEVREGISEGFSPEITGFYTGIYTTCVLIPPAVGVLGFVALPVAIAAGAGLGVAAFKARGAIKQKSKQSANYDKLLDRRDWENERDVAQDLSEQSFDAQAVDPSVPPDPVARSILHPG